MTSKVKIKIKLDKGATMPEYAHLTDVGADVKACRTWLVQGNGTEHELRTIRDCMAMKDKGIDCAKIKIDTGVHVQPADGHYTEIVPNSRLAKTPFMYANGFGVSFTAAFEQVDELAVTERGDGGFGSTANS